MERLRSLLKSQARMRDFDEEEDFSSEAEEELQSTWTELDSGNASDSSSESGGSLQSSSVLSSPTLSSNASASPMMISNSNNNNHSNHNNNNNANATMMNHTNFASSPLIGSSSTSGLPPSTPASSAAGAGFFASMMGGSSFSFGIGTPKLEFFRNKRQRKKIRGKNGTDSDSESPSTGVSPFSSPLLSFRSSFTNNMVISDSNPSLSQFPLFSELPVELRVSPLQWMSIAEFSKAALVCKEWAYIVQQSHELWKGQFHKIQTFNSPPVRVCHGALTYKDSLFVYGGHVPSEQGDFITSVRSDLWEYNITTHEWKKVCNFEPLTETSPILYNDRMYIFGGFINSWRTSTIIEYDFLTRKYTKTVSEENPTPLNGAPPKGRSAYSAVVYKNCMYIYGGWDGHESMNDIHCFNLDTKQWIPQHPPPPQQQQQLPQEQQQQQQQQQQQNNNTTAATTTTTNASEHVAPCVRSHTAWVWNDSMYVWGGYGQHGHPTDLFRYNFLEEDVSKRWSKVIVKGTPPCGRSRMKCLVFENRVFIIGGWDRKTLLGDVWQLDMETSTWTELKHKGLPKGLSQYSVNLYKNVLLAFGGCSNGESSNNLYGFKLFGRAQS